MLVIDLDVYGRYARFSAIADFLELLALGGVPTSEDQLAEHISDADWAVNELFLAEGERRPLARHREDATDQARSVYSTLEERREVLGNKWPFRFDGSRLVPTERDPRADPYVALLAITMSHAYDLAGPLAPEVVFEDTVADVIGGRDLLVSNFGRVARGAGSFEQALTAAGTQVRLMPTAEAAVRKVHAQDEKVDTLCHMWWGDVRPGLWCFIGQATCAKSEEWEHKIKDPAPNAWSKLLNAEPLPLPFLAVPHHVEGLHLAKLVQDSTSVVLDRLRLVNFKKGVRGDEAIVIDFVLGAEIEKPWD